MISLHCIMLAYHWTGNRKTKISLLPIGLALFRLYYAHLLNIALQHSTDKEKEHDWVYDMLSIPIAILHSSPAPRPSFTTSPSIQLLPRTSVCIKYLDKQIRTAKTPSQSVQSDTGKTRQGQDSRCPQEQLSGRSTGQRRGTSAGYPDAHGALHRGRRARRHQRSRQRYRQWYRCVYPLAKPA